MSVELDLLQAGGIGLLNAVVTDGDACKERHLPLTQ